MRKVYIFEGLEKRREFWDRIWSKCSLQEAVKEVETNFMLPIFLKYFTKDGKILEAGCGLGKYVIYFTRKGYNIEGIDFAQETINRIKKYDATLPARVDDLRRIDCQDEYYTVYYSGGVIEHYEEGASSILREAYRVLKKDGFLIITVPYVNLIKYLDDLIWFFILRKRKRLIKSIDNTSYLYFLTDTRWMNKRCEHGWWFYQYVYRKKEIEKILRESCFKPIFSKRVQVQWGIKTFIKNAGFISFNERKNNPYVNFIKKYLFCENEIRSIGRILISILGLFFAHQILFVCKKLEG